MKKENDSVVEGATDWDEFSTRAWMGSSWSEHCSASLSNSAGKYPPFFYNISIESRGCGFVAYAQDDSGLFSLGSCECAEDQFEFAYLNAVVRARPPWVAVTSLVGLYLFLFPFCVPDMSYLLHFIGRLAAPQREYF